MINVGREILFQVCCPECGKPQQQLNGSEFFFLNCQNSDCLFRYANIVVERKSGRVISCDAYVMGRTKDGDFGYERAFPVFQDEDGNKV